MKSTNTDLSNSMLYITFNQDNSCFAIGTETGFRIHSTTNNKDFYVRNMDGGIGVIEMLGRSNLLALVGGGMNPKYSLNSVVIWDDEQSKIVREYHFIYRVIKVKVKQDKIFIVCETKIYIFTLSFSDHLETLNTFPNPKGLISLSTDTETCILAYLFKESGKIAIKDFDTSKEIIILAHENNISFFSLNHYGTFIATTGEKGTNIRIYQVRDGRFVQEFRRGSEKAEIFSMCFDITDRFLCVSSDRKTIHIFLIDYMPEYMEENGRKKSGGILGILGIGVDRSFAKLKMNDNVSVCAFGQDSRTILVVSDEGKFYRTEFNNKKGGDCKILEEKNIFTGE